MGVAIPDCGGLGSSFIHALTDHTYRPGSTLRGALSHPLGPDLTWGLAADCDSEPEGRHSAPCGEAGKNPVRQRRAVGSHASEAEVGQERPGNPGPRTRGARGGGRGGIAEARLCWLRCPRLGAHPLPGTLCLGA